MKRYARWCLLGTVIAGCQTGGGGGTTPTPVVAGPPAGWTGTTRYVDETLRSGGLDVATYTFDSSVSWARDERAPAPPAGGARYAIGSGVVHVVYRAVLRFQGDCTIDGAVDVPLAPPSGPYDPVHQSYLELGANGEYRGALYAEAAVPYIRQCAGKAPQAGTADARMSVYRRGTVGSGRIQGQMPPEAFSGTTLTGTWDFGPR